MKCEIHLLFHGIMPLKLSLFSGFGSIYDFVSDRNYSMNNTNTIICKAQNEVTEAVQYEMSTMEYCRTLYFGNKG